MKNILKSISVFAVMAVAALSSCVEKEPDYTDFPSKDVDFTYAVEGDQYKLDYYVVSTLQFTNTSSKQGAVTWDFGDGTTSTEANPLHKFAKAGTYKVTLTVEGVGSRTYPVMITDIAPVLTVKDQSAPVLTINDVSVDFNIFLPNPENLKVKYVWTFPEGTLKEDGTEITTFTGTSDAQGNIQYPGRLHFRNIGSQRITLQTWFDTDGENRRLDDSFVNVQVGANHECKTIYYAALDGNIMAYKLVDESKLPAGTKNLPFDLGVSSGNMPMNLVCTPIDNGDGTTSDWIYVLDAGKQYTYINDANGVNGDGKISCMKTDGTEANIVVTNVGQTAFGDPFFGCVDGSNLLYSDRNTGLRTVALKSRGEKEQNTYFVQNNQLGYYNKSYSYGAISTSIVKDASGVYWWGKCFNGTGIFRFRSTDIDKTDAEPNAVVLPSISLKAFALDETRKALYVWRTVSDGGFYVYPLPADKAALDGKSFTTRILMDADPLNAAAGEGVYCTQMAVDTETGYVFFGFNKEAKDSSPYTTGLKYYDPSTQKIVSFAGNSNKILGVAINDTKSKLF